MKKKITFVMFVFMVIALFGCGHSHKWGEVTYRWSDDNSTCTAERVCKEDESHKETETVSTQYEIVEEAECDEAGKLKYTATFENEAFETQTKDVVTSALSHDLIHHNAKDPTCTSVGWNAYDTCSRCDYSTYVELPSLGHSPSEAVIENKIDATCTLNGSYDSVVYCSVCHEELSRTHEVISALSHDLVHHDAQAATCTNIGWNAYDTCSRCDFSTYSEIPALDHDYQFVSFVWSDYTAQAKCVCSHDQEHVKYVDAVVTSKVTLEPTCYTEGVRTYTATYGENSATKTETIASSHKWSTPTYTWSNDYSTCTAKVYCTVEQEVVIIETVNSTITQNTATFQTAGDITYVAEFENALFTKQTFVEHTRVITWDKLSFSLIDGDSYSVERANSNVTGVVSIPDTYNGKPVTLIKYNGFDYCEITELYVGKEVTEIGDCAFNCCENLVKVVFVSESKLSKIGRFAFSTCGFSSISLPNGVHYINDGAFSYCDYLGTINYEGTVQEWLSGTIFDNWTAYDPVENVTCNGGTVGVHEGTYFDHWDIDDDDDDDDEFDW